MATVLLVEDDADIREMIRAALEGHGLSVRSAGTDKSAYAILEREARSFALLVADINLGEGTTGFDVARRARRLHPDMKVIFTSGRAAEVERFGVEGAELLAKPLRPDELADRAVAIIASKPSH